MHRSLRSFLLVSACVLCTAFVAAEKSALLQKLPSYEVVDLIHERPAPHLYRGPTASELRHSSQGPAHEETMHPTHRIIAFKAYDKQFTIELRKNHMLLPGTYYEHRHANGRIVSKKERKDVVNCYYTGTVLSHEGNGVNRVAVDTCQGVRGYIQAHDGIYFIEPAPRHLDIHSSERHHTRAPHVIYRSADLPEYEFGCGVDHEHEHESARPLEDIQEDEENHVHLGKNDLEHRIRPAKFQPQAVSPGAKYPKLLLINDVGRFRYFTASNGLETESKSMALMNIAAGFYHTDTSQTVVDQIVLSVVGQVTITDDTSQDGILAISSATPISYSTYLPTMCEWSKLTYSKLDTYTLVPNVHDSTVLLSGYDFVAPVIGYAYRTGMCTDLGCAINQANHELDSNKGQLFDAATIAHELGHNLGMCHDSSRVSCPTLNGVTEAECTDFIMSPSSDPNNPADTFSRCSNNDITAFITTVESPSTSSNYVSHCFAEPTAVYGNTSICGNGFIEADEECDCGLNPASGLHCKDVVGVFKDACCNSTSCKLIVPTAKCSSRYSCCQVDDEASGSCSFKPAGTACGTGDQTCDGTTAKCPAATDSSNDSAIVSFLKDNQDKIIVVGVVILLLIAVYYFLHWCWDCMCGDDEKEEEANAKGGFGRARTMVRKQAQSFRKKKKNRNGRHVAVEMASPNTKHKTVTVAGIQLPPNWQVKYTREGIPIYINTITNERFDFRSGPPAAFGQPPPPPAAHYAAVPRPHMQHQQQQQQQQQYPQGGGYY